MSVNNLASTSDVHVFGEGEFIDGGEVLPGLVVKVADVFTDLDIGQASASSTVPFL